MRCIITLMAFLVINSHGFSAIDYYFIWGTTDEEECLATADASATGGPNINISIIGEAGIPTVGPVAAGLFSLTGTVTVHSEKKYPGGTPTVRWYVNIETVYDSFESPLENSRGTHLTVGLR